MSKPFSQASVNNREPILKQLQSVICGCSSVLEVGSGTGQHAVYFSWHLPYIQWQTSDLVENHEGINAWIDSVDHDNCLRPFMLDVTEPVWCQDKFDAVYTANTLHIISWSHVKAFFQHVVHVLQPGGLLMVYGPFNYGGSYTSDSNARFDEWLKDTDAERGIRDIEAVNDLANANGLEWVDDYSMPANNRLQVWRFKQ